MRPAVLFAVVFGFLVGVFARSFLPLGYWSMAFVFLLAFSVATAGFRESGGRALLVVVFLVASAGGIARMHAGIWERDRIADALVGEKATIEGVVVDEPDERENNVRIPVRIEKIGSEDIVREAVVLVVAPLHTDIRYGDRIRATGELDVPQRFEVGGRREFDYPGYLAKDGILYELSFATVEKTGDVTRNPLKSFALWLKRLYLDGLAMALPEPAAGLAGGITAGDKRGLGSDLSQVFRTVGLVHIVVLSGYNIMVVIGFIESLFSWTRVWVRSVLGAAIAILFAFMTGLASSSVRAASMAIIATAGKTTGRIYLAERALAVVAFGMVLWNPYVLAFDPGFQLSVLATLGLMFVSPLAGARLTWVTERFGLRETAASTIGTQAAVVPLLLYQNGMLSLYALPTNLLALAAVPYAMLLSFIAGIAGIALGPIAPIVAYPAYLLLSYIIAVAQFFAAVPFSSVSAPQFSPVLLIGAYCIGVIGFVLQRKAAKPVGLRRR